jgi:tetratricopeptide (TPR) repeat protein
LKVEDCLRQWLAKRGFASKSNRWDRLLHGSPFPGLESFDATRAAVFFGRELAIRQSVERLREAGADDKRLPFLLILGASGAGKSSLLRAGLLPRLTLPGTIPEVDLWRVAVVTTGPDPADSLAESLLGASAIGPELAQGAFADKALLARLLAGDPATALAPLREGLAKAAEERRVQANFDAPRPARLLLAIDQGERLFTEAEPAKAAHFAELMAAAARERLAYVVFVMRSDAYPRLQAVPALLELRDKRASFDLIRPSPGELEEMVKGPVEACDPPLAFETREGHSLAERLVDEAKGGDALPLLGVTLARLYQAEEGRKDGVLRFDDYRGLAVAVSETADEAMKTLDPSEKAELPALVAALVSDVAPDPLTGAPAPVVAPLERKTFEDGRPSRTKLIDAFIEKRLLTSEGDGASARVRPVHEALLRIWPDAEGIVVETSGLIRVRHALEPIVREWVAAGESDKPGYLQISLPLLAGAQQLVARFGTDLSPTMRDFIARATAADAERRNRERRRQRTILAATASALVAMTMLAGAAVWQWRQAETQRQLADTQRKLAESTLLSATSAANAMVSQLAKSMRDRKGMPIDLVRDILDRAQSLQRQLIASWQDRPELLLSEGKALNEVVLTEFALGDSASALKAAEDYRNLMDDLVKRDPKNAEVRRELSFGLNRFGDALMRSGQDRQALDEYRRSVALREDLARDDPNNRQAQDDLAAALEKLGVSQHALGGDQDSDADKSYLASLAIREHLVRDQPENEAWRRDLSLSYERRGLLLHDFGDDEAALTSLDNGLAIRKQLAAEKPGDTQSRRDLANAFDQIGVVRLLGGDFDEALANFEKSRDLRKGLADSDLKNLEWQRDLAVGYAHSGDALFRGGSHQKALDQYHSALAIRERLATADRDNADWQTDLVLDLRRLALAGEEPRANLTRALDITKRLQASGKLAADKEGWAADLEELLAKTPP